MVDLEVLYTQKNLGVGCSTFGGSNSKQTARKTLEYCFEKGLFYYDVARSYGYGQAESIVGNFAKDKRSQLVIATKFGILPPRNIPFKNLIISGVRTLRKVLPKSNSVIKNVSGKALVHTVFTPQLLVQSLETSLRELKTDYIDIYLFHESRFEDLQLDDVRYILEKEKEKGKIRAYGGTLGEREDLKKLLEHPDTVQVMQVPFGLDQTFSEAVHTNAHIHVVYSVLNYARTFSNETGMAVLHQVKQQFPQVDFVRNFAELLLFVAYNEIGSGVLLLSMNKEEHINRNIFISKKAALNSEQLNGIKDIILAHTPA